MLFVGSPEEPVRRALDAEAAAVEDMGVDHRGSDVAVPEQLMDGANVIARLQEMRCETVSITRIIHELSAATAHTPLQRVVSPLSRSTYRREYVSLLRGSERPFRWRLSGFTTNLHE